MDYAQFMTGLEVTAAQAFYTQGGDADTSLAAAFRAAFKPSTISPFMALARGRAI